MENVSSILPDGIVTEEKYWKRFKQCLLSFFHSAVFKGDKIDSLRKLQMSSLLTGELNQKDITDFTGDMSVFKTSSIIKQF